MGHINAIGLKKIYNNISEEDIEEIKKCNICIRAKATNKIYKTSTNKTNYDYLEKIASDICGPFKDKTYNKYQYFLTFLDKKTRYLEVKLLRNKDETYNAFLEFKARNENNKDNKRIRIYQTDLGTEFINKRFNSLFNKEGIIHQTGPAYTKEPNGFFERINRTLLNIVRSLLITSNLPKYLWGEALEAAVYIYNRTPHSGINFISPYEAKMAIKPDLGNIKIWGSTVYYKIKDINLSKLDPRAQRGILVGYGTDSHNYKIYNLIKRIAAWYRDITILEGQFYKPDNYDIINNNNIDISVKNTPNTITRSK